MQKGLFPTCVIGTFESFKVLSIYSVVFLLNFRDEESENGSKNNSDNEEVKEENVSALHSYGQLFYYYFSLAY